jgi:hypothetical protein
VESGQSSKDDRYAKRMVMKGLLESLLTTASKATVSYGKMLSVGREVSYLKVEE